MSVPLDNTYKSKRPDFQYKCNHIPFIGTINEEMSGKYLEKLLLIIFGIFIAPFRLVILVSSWLIMWCIAKIICPITENTLISKFRNLLLYIILRIQLFSFGVYQFETKNLQNKPKNSKIVIAAPHSTISDNVIWYHEIYSAVISADYKTWPLVGKIMQLCNPIFVDRATAKSRKDTVERILQHSKQENSLPILFFPEGTTTNGKSLMHFKHGAFIPGLPITPITIKFETWPFSSNLSQWTWVGTPNFGSYILILCCPFNKITLEYLPEYFPDEEEKNDPDLFAFNVQNKMAKSLNIEATDWMLEDARLAAWVVAKGLNHKKVLGIKFANLCQNLGFSPKFKLITTIMEDYIQFYDQKLNPVDISVVADKLNCTVDEIKKIYQKPFLTPEEFLFTYLKYLQDSDKIITDKKDLRRKASILVVDDVNSRFERELINL